MSLIKPNINKFMSEKKDLTKSIPDSNDLVNEIILLKQKKKLLYWLTIIKILKYKNWLII